MACYLVTGAAGFIGSKVCEQLLSRGDVVVGIDNLNDYYDVRLKDYRLGRLLNATGWISNKDSKRSWFKGPEKCSDGNFTFLELDVEDAEGLARLFNEYRFDAIFNLAARAGVRASVANPYVFLSTNTEGTLNILECQRKFGVTKQVLASTSSLYAGGPTPFTEDQPVNTPLSPYAAAKKAAELLAYTYHKLYALDITVLRYFTVFGPAGRPDMAPFRFTHNILFGRPIIMYGDGSQSRDFTYIDDIAAGTIAAAKPLGYEIINLGGGRTPTTLRQMIDVIAGTLRMAPLIEQKPFHAADMKETCADIARAKALLSWSPRTLPEDGFREMVAWHLNNAHWLAAIEI